MIKEIISPQRVLRAKGQQNKGANQKSNILPPFARHNLADHATTVVLTNSIVTLQGAKKVLDPPVIQNLTYFQLF